MPPRCSLGGFEFREQTDAKFEGKRTEERTVSRKTPRDVVETRRDAKRPSFATEFRTNRNYIALGAISRSKDENRVPVVSGRVGISGIRLPRKSMAPLRSPLSRRLYTALPQFPVSLYGPCGERSKVAEKFGRFVPFDRSKRVDEEENDSKSPSNLSLVIAR